VELFETFTLRCASEEASSVAILSVDLLRSLISRLHNRSSDWWPSFHQHFLMQTLLYQANHCLLAKAHPELLQSMLGTIPNYEYIYDFSTSTHCISGLLCLVAKTEKGRDGCLASDLEPTLWSPLSDVKSHKKQDKWMGVLGLALTLAAILQQSGGSVAFVQSSLNAALLLQEHVTAALALPRALVDKEKGAAMAGATAFLAQAMPFFKSWNIEHPQSLAHWYQTACATLHHATCLLIRPATLAQMVSAQRENDAEEASPTVAAPVQRRARHASTSASASEVELEGTSSSMAWAHTALLENCAAILAGLHAVSPSLADILGGEYILQEEFHHRHLVAVAFSSPSLEQDVRERLEELTLTLYLNRTLA